MSTELSVPQSFTRCGLTVLSLWLLAAGTMSGADVSLFDLSLEKLAEVVVTDTKIAQPRHTVTQKLESIRAAEFEFQSMPQRNIAELLRHTAGQFVNPLSRNDANWGSYAGLGPKYNTYLLDGLPIDSFADAMSLDPWAFQEVEIHKGPASVLYSNFLSMDFAGNEMSLAGITNFILKDRIDSPSSRLSFGVGSFGTYNTRLYHQDRAGNFSYFVGGSFEYSDYADYGTPDSWLHMVQSPGYAKAKAYAKLAYATDDGSQKLSLFVHHTDHHGGTGRPNRDFVNRYDTVNAVYSRQLGPAWNLQIKSGYRNYDRSWEDDNYPIDLSLRENSGVKQTILPSDLTLTYLHAGQSVLTMGTDLQLASYETYQVVNEVEARSVGLFLQEKFVAGRWVYRVGGRANRTDQSYDLVDGARPALQDKQWNSQLWSAGVRYNATPALSFYGNAGSSFVAPSAKSVCGTIAAADAGVIGRNGQLPNANLRPEKGIGSDFGVEWHPDSSLSFGVRGFLNRIDDAIVDNVVSTTPSQSISVNAGRAQSHGFELIAERSVNHRFKWFANFTRNFAEVSNSIAQDEDGTAIPFVPDYVANLGVTATLPRGVVVSPRFQMVGDYFDSTSQSGRQGFGSYHVINIRIQAVAAERPNYSIRCTLDLNNVLDRRYRLPFQFRDPGFNAFFSTEIGF